MTKKQKINKEPNKKMVHRGAISLQEMVGLGRYLRSLREDLDMSLRGAATLGGISPAHLCKIEQGTSFKSIGIEVLLRLTVVYNIPLSSILEEAGLIQENSGKLPEFSQYLRSKYSLSPQAIRDLETAKEVVDKKYKHTEIAQSSLFQNS